MPMLVEFLWLPLMFFVGIVIVIGVDVAVVVVVTVGVAAKSNNVAICFLCSPASEDRQKSCPPLRSVVHTHLAKAAN